MPPKFEGENVLAAALAQMFICRATDPIDMHYLFEGDPDSQAEVTEVRLAAEAQAHRVIADAADKIAQIVAKKTKKP